MSRLKLSLITLLSTCLMWGERFFFAFMPVILCGLIAISALVLLPPSWFTPLFSALYILLALGSFGVLIYRAAASFTPPTRHETARRIERDSHVAHRPLSGSHDRPSVPHEEAQVLWALHLSDLKRRLSLLSFAKLSCGFIRRDPYGIQFLIVAMGLLVLTFQASELSARVRLLGSPLHAMRSLVPERTLSLTLIAPEYTRLEHKALSDSDDNTSFTLPSGTRLKAIVSGGWHAPKMMIDGEVVHRFAETGDRIYTLEADIPAGERLSIAQFLREYGAWDYTLLEDKAPSITMDGEVRVLPEGTLRLPLSVHDDYGVEEIRVSMDIDPLVEQPPLGEALSQTRSVMSRPDETLTLQPVYDFTSHPWAGLPVTLSVSVSDHLGQMAELPPIQITLPERVFRHPTARALADMRKVLAWEPALHHPEMVDQLYELMGNTKHFNNDPMVFLALRMAASRMSYSPPSEANAQALMALLWDTAMAVEDGDLNTAMRALREAQNALEDGMKNPDITDPQIAALMDDVRKAMQSYLMELQRAVQKNALPFSPENFDTVVNPDALNTFMDQLEQALREGDTMRAKDMLAELQTMMDMMQPGSAQMPPDMQMMQEGVSELQQLIERQTALRDQTKNIVDRASKPPSFGELLPFNNELLNEWGITEMPPAPSAQEPRALPKIDTSANKTEQEALRFVLGQLMLDAAEVLENIPEGMGLAEQEMRSSSAALGESDPARSIPHQDKALEYLKQSQQELSEQLSQRMQQMGGMALSGGQKYDPLGRPYGGEENEGGMFPGSRVKIPDAAERKRAMEILRELRRRSSQRGRFRDELQYHRRLLKQF